jgi:hypothetical protein
MEGLGFTAQGRKEFKDFVTSPIESAGGSPAEMPIETMGSGRRIDGAA